MSLYERLGGHTPLTTIVDDFYRSVLADPDLAPYFAHADVTHIKRHQVLLLTSILGGPDNYKNRDLKTAHKHLNITLLHFYYVRDHLLNTLAHYDVPEDIIDAIHKAIINAAPSIVNPQNAG